MIKRFKCWLGFHHWEYFDDYEEWFRDVGYWQDGDVASWKICQRCKKQVISHTRY